MQHKKNDSNAMLFVLYILLQVSPEPPSYIDSDSEVEFDRSTPVQSATNVINHRELLPNVPLDQNDQMFITKKVSC